MGYAFLWNKSGDSMKVPVLDDNYPGDVTVVADNSTATFQVKITEAGSPADYTYQWYKNGTAVSGATGVTYTLSGLNSIETSTVYCVVTNKAGTVTSRVATLKVYATAPKLNGSYPANASVVADNGSATFKVEISTAGVPAKYTYQWYKDGAAVSGATSATYTITGLNASATHKIYCIVGHKAGNVKSAEATLTAYLTKPVLNSSYPANVTVTEGPSGSATFKVEIATAGAPAKYTYQWYVNNTAVSGATSASYTKSSLTDGTKGTYSVYCVVGHKAGNVTSKTATLTVNQWEPTYTYTGTSQFINDGNYNWRLKLKTTGDLTFTNFGYRGSSVDIFLVGGGGAGGGPSHGQWGCCGGGGAGGGYTTTQKAKTASLNTKYTVTVGAGATSIGGTGGTSSISGFGYTAAGGKGGGTAHTNNPSDYCGGAGGAGGSGGAGGWYHTSSDGANKSGGSNGSNGAAGNGEAWAGTGQNTTTYEFGESGSTLYSGGGGGAAGSGGQWSSDGNWGTGSTGGSGGGGAGGSSPWGQNLGGGAGTANLGGGGGGICPSRSLTGTGGSGIVIIRNKR